MVAYPPPPRVSWSVIARSSFFIYCIVPLKAMAATPATLCGGQPCTKSDSFMGGLGEFLGWPQSVKMLPSSWIWPFGTFWGGLISVHFQGCGVVLTVARRLVVRQARVRISARHPEEALYRTTMENGLLVNMLRKLAKGARQSKMMTFTYFSICYFKYRLNN